jgi:hypothetical protein
MSKSKKTTGKTATPKTKAEVAAKMSQELHKPDTDNTPEVTQVVEVVMEEASQPEIEEQTPVCREEILSAEDNNGLRYKARIGNSKIWANQLLAANNKYFERYFFLAENAEVAIGTQLFTDESLNTPFIGSDGWITISSTEGEHNSVWNCCQVDSDGFIKSVVTI